MTSIQTSDMEMKDNTQEPLCFASVERIPGFESAAVFMPSSTEVLREDVDVVPVPVGDKGSYIPWGHDDSLPYDILDLIEKDETISTCQQFNAEVLYGSGLRYVTDDERAARFYSDDVETFFIDNDMAGYFLGTAQDFKYFGFAVTLLVLDDEHSRILGIRRKEAMYCRFSEVDGQGNIPYVFFANWRLNPSPEKVERIPLLDIHAPLSDLRERTAHPGCGRKFAMLTRIPTIDSTYYPIPYYAALFRGRWYNIKQLIGLAKEAKLKNSAPIKYQIEISGKYWESIFKAEGITSREEKRRRVESAKKEIIEFLTGAENSGKVWFSTFYVTPDGQEQHDVVIHKIDASKEGGDWATDIQEAINMICFTMRVHSNLVGSVPGKSQSNNSGSDKRELYTIAQALQKPYRDILFTLHRLVIAFNGWKGYRPEIPFIQLSTLDEHRDAKKVTMD